MKKIIRLKNNNMCDICCSETVKTNKCSQCELNTCRSCDRKCVIEFTQLTHCERCHRVWSVSESHTRLGITFFRKQYRNMRRQVLKRTMLPVVPMYAQLAHREGERRKLKRRILDLTRLVRDHDRMDLVPELYHTRRKLRDVSESNTNTFRHCPHPGCTGMIAPNEPCTLCENMLCMECEQVYRDGLQHVCDAEIVQNVQSMRRDTRPCPSCTAPSMKSEGCPVMWCVYCHCFWNWDSERILPTSRSVPHNPDHRDWVRRNGEHRHRNEHDVPCGGVPDHIVIHDALIREMEHSPMIVWAHTIIEAMHSMESAQTLRLSYPRHPRERMETLCVGFILGDYTEHQFVSILERRERSLEFNDDVASILECYVFSCVDIFNLLSEGVDCHKTVLQLNALRNITYDALVMIGRQHQRTVPMLLRNWEWVVPRRV